MSEKQKNKFLLQGSILAAATIICRIIGLLYRRPLTAIVGNTGMGYYGYAYNVYNIILLVASFSIPLAVSKAISARLAVHEYRNANRIFKGAMVYAVVVGSIAALITYLGAPYFLPNAKGAVLALRVMTPTIFFSGILGVLRGYFQGHNTMVPTSVSQIIEQILNAIVSVMMAYVLIRPYVMINTPEGHNQVASFGAAGSAIGTGAGVMIGLIFCLIVYRIYLPQSREHIRNDHSGQVEPYSRILKILLLTITPVILSTALYNCSAVIDATLFSWLMKVKGMTERSTAALFGIFTNQYNVLINVPIAMASALSNAIVPDISGAYAVGNEEQMKHSIHTAIKFTMMISIPCAVGLGVLAKPVVGLLFGPIHAFGLGPYLLRWGAVSIVFSCLSTLTNGILQGMSRMKVPVRHSAVAVTANVVILVFLLQFTNLQTYALVAATTMFALIMCILNARSIRKYTGYHQELSETFLKPCISAVVMGIVIFIFLLISSWLLPPSSVSYAFCILLAVPAGALIYFMMIMKLHLFSEEELLAIPKGALMVKAAKKLKLF